MSTPRWAAVALCTALAACDRGTAEAPRPVGQPAPTTPAAPHPVEHAAGPALTAAELGKPAPEFSLRDTEGKTFRLSELRGKTVVLEWFNPDCPFVKSAHTRGPLVDMAKQAQSSALVWLSINSSAPGKQGHGVERNQRAASEYGLVNPVLLDESGSVGRAYGATKTPHLFVIDPEGILVYRGGLDNAPMGVVDDARPRSPTASAGTLEPYLRTALEALRAGQPIALADTPAYGCSIKYAD